jgi:hypothetical protein
MVDSPWVVDSRSWMVDSPVSGRHAVGSGRLVSGGRLAVVDGRLVISATWIVISLDWAVDMPSRLPGSPARSVVHRAGSPRRRACATCRCRNTTAVAGHGARSRAAIDCGAETGNATVRQPTRGHRNVIAVYEVVTGQPGAPGMTSALLTQMFRLRYEVFYQQLAWEVDGTGDLERDEFDDLDPVYVLAVRHPTTPWWAACACCPPPARTCCAMSRPSSPRYRDDRRRVRPASGRSAGSPSRRTPPR